MAGFHVARLDEIEEIDDGRCPFRPVRHHLGITTFGVTAVSGRDGGDRLINEHEHDEAEPESGEELYVVTSGHATFEVDGESVDAPPERSSASLPGPSGPRSPRRPARRCSALAVRPPASRTRQWMELFAPLFPLFESGEYEEGADRAQALIADDPPYGYVYFNTACFESQAGRIDAAIAHLRRAVEIFPALKVLARDDEDLAALRTHAAFAEITGD